MRRTSSPRPASSGTAAETARTAVRAARDKAPEKPSYAEQLGDGLQELQIMGDHVGDGIIKGTAGLLNFVRQVNPLDPYNITHPVEYATSLNSLTAGLVVAANGPVGTGRQMISDFMKDPYEGFGRLLPDVALTVATGGGGAAVKGVRIAADMADAVTAAQAGRRRPGRHPQHLGRRPQSRRRPGGPRHGPDVPAPDRHPTARHTAAGLHPSHRVRLRGRPLPGALLDVHCRRASGDRRGRRRPRHRQRARDLDVLDDPLEARIGIAPDVALLVQDGAVVGWSLTDPARYLTTGFAAPAPNPPSPATRLLFTECLDLITTPLLDAVRRRDPAALASLRALDHKLRNQREDRHRTDALLALIGDLVEDYADRPTEQKP